MKRLKDHNRSKLRVLAHIWFLSIGEINKLKFPGINRKPILFIDKRELRRFFWLRNKRNPGTNGIEDVAHKRATFPHKKVFHSTWVIL